MVVVVVAVLWFLVVLTPRSSDRVVGLVCVFHVFRVVRVVRVGGVGGGGGVGVLLLVIAREESWLRSTQYGIR